MPRVGRIWTVAVLLTAAVAVAGVSAAEVAKASVGGKMTYSQHKYHKMSRDKTQEWHHCDLTVNAKILTDFTLLQNPDAQLQVRPSRRSARAPK